MTKSGNGSTPRFLLEQLFYEKPRWRPGKKEGVKYLWREKKPLSLLPVNHLNGDWLQRQPFVPMFTSDQLDKNLDPILKIDIFFYKEQIFINVAKRFFANYKSLKKF